MVDATPFSAATLGIVRGGLSPDVARHVSDVRIAQVLDELLALRIMGWGGRARALGRRPVRLTRSGAPRPGVAREVAAQVPLGSEVADRLPAYVASDLMRWLRDGKTWGSGRTRLLLMDDELVADPGAPERFVMPPLGERAIVLE